MSGVFDPYDAWLRIPSHEQPPDHYRLLGLNVLEADPAAIHAAAQRLLAQLNALGVGEYQPTASRLMAEVVAARDCLLTPPAKAAYDQQLLAAYGPPPTRSPPAFFPPEHAPSPMWQAPPHSAPMAEQPNYAPFPSQPQSQQPQYSETQYSQPQYSQPPNPHGQPQKSPAETGTGLQQPGTADASASFNRPIPLGPASHSDPGHSVSASPAPETRRNRKRNRREKTPQEIAVEAAKIAGGGIAGLTVATLLLWFGLGSDPLGIFSGAEQPARNQTVETKRGPAERSGSRAVVSPTDNGAVGGGAGPIATQRTRGVVDDAGPAVGVAPPGAATSVVDAANPSEGVGIIVAKSDPGEGNVISPTPRATAQLPVPSAEEQAEKLALIREVFAEQLAAGGKDPASAAAFFLNQARSLDNDPASKFMLLKQAFQFAGATPDFDQGEAVISELIRHFEMDARLLKLFLIEQVATSARTESDRNRLMNEALAMSRQLQQRSQFDLADRMASTAEALALKLRDPGVRIAAKNILTENKERRVADKRLALLAKSIAEKPDDPDLNTRYGTVMCVQRQDWKLGLFHLARGLPGALRDAAALDIAAEEDPSVSQKAAERWEEIGRSDDALNVFYLRALRWYRQAAAGAGGLEKIRLENRIAAIESESGVKELTSSDSPAPADLKPAETSGRLAFAPRRRTAVPASSDVGAAFSPSGTEIAVVGRTGRVATWSVADRTPTRTLGYPAGLGAPTCLAAASDFVACGFADGGVMVWSFEKGSVVNQFAAHDEAISALKFSQDGKVLLTTDDSHLKVWSLASKGILGGAEMPGQPVSAALSADGSLAAVCVDRPQGNFGSGGYTTSGLVFWNVARNVAAARLPLTSYGRRVAISPSGRQVACAVCSSFRDTSGTWSVLVVDPASGRTMMTLRASGTVRDLIYSPRGELLYVTTDDGVTVYSADNFVVEGQISGDGVTGFALTQDGTAAAVIDASQVYILDLFGPGGARDAPLPAAVDLTPPRVVPNLGARPAMTPATQPALDAAPRPPLNATPRPALNALPPVARRDSALPPAGPPPAPSVATRPSLSAESPLPSRIDRMPRELFPTAPGPLTLELNDSLADLPEGHRIQILPRDDIKDRWRAVVRGDSAPDGGEVLAEFARLDGKLHFAWIDGANPAAAQLQHCILAVSTEKDRKTRRLRALRIEPRCVADVDDEARSIRFDLGAIPRSDSLRMEVQAPPGGRIKGESAVAIGRSVTLEFDAMPEIVVRFRVKSLGKGTFELTSETHHVTPTTDIPLSRRRLSIMQEAAEKSLLKYKQELVNCSNELPGLLNQRASIANTSIPLTNTLRNMARDTAMFEVNLRINNLNRKIALNKERVPQLESRLREHIPKLRSLLDQLEGTRIGVSIFAAASKADNFECHLPLISFSE